MKRKIDKKRAERGKRLVENEKRYNETTKIDESRSFLSQTDKIILNCYVFESILERRYKQQKE